MIDLLDALEYTQRFRQDAEPEHLSLCDAQILLAIDTHPGIDSWQLAQVTQRDETQCRRAVLHLAARRLIIKHAPAETRTKRGVRSIFEPTDLGSEVIGRVTAEVNRYDLYRFELSRSVGAELTGVV